MRSLETGALVELESGLWAVDAFQPVAAVLDPASGDVRGVVNWREQPPSPAPPAWPGVRIIGAGDSLWVQQERSGPLLRVTTRGVAVAVWTRGLQLTTATADAAWCASAPPEQEIIHGAGAKPAGYCVSGQLLRVDRDGTCQFIGTPAPVVSLRAEPEGMGLLVELSDEPWRLHEIGDDSYEVVHVTRWLRLPSGEPFPDTLTLEEHAIPVDEVPDVGRPTIERHHITWYAPDSPRALEGMGWHWRLGWALASASRRPHSRRDLVAGRFDPATGVLAGEHGLGQGTIRALVTVGAEVVVAVERPFTFGYRTRPRVDVLALSPSSGDQPAVLLPGGAVDITAWCWPPASQPIEADSYLRQTLIANHHIDRYWRHADGRTQPLARGITGARTEIVGRWPDACLQWTFTHDRFPGLQLRRQVPLFDELGRIDPPEHADIHLMEDLDTGEFDASGRARDGILSI